MYYSFCLGCGSKISNSSTECPLCGFENGFEQESDPFADEKFFDDFSDTFDAEDDYY